MGLTAPRSINKQLPLPSSTATLRAMNFDLSGRTAIVTGASSGFGAHFAKTLAGHGASVALCARRVDRLEALRDELRATGARAESFPLDVGVAESCGEVVAQVSDTLGTPTILLNNAGIDGAAMAIDQRLEQFEQVIAVNLTGVFAMAQAAAQAMRDAATGGSIVNTASILALRQGQALTAYAASKAAVAQMTKQMALEWARYGIRVNALAPGYFPTEINQGHFDTPQGKAMLEKVPMRRLGRLEELDAPMMLLASDAGSFMTGTVIPVDGGHLVSSL